MKNWKTKVNSFFVVYLGIVFSIFAQNKFLYKTERLEIQQLTENTFIHISYLETDSWGKVGCNGLVFISKNEAAIFDTPTNNEASEELIHWLTAKGISVKAVVVNHFHDDCLGGLQAFHNKNVVSYANATTLELATKAGEEVPKIGFKNENFIKIGNKKVHNIFLGEAHTKDNIVSYIASEKVLFGGCQVKTLDATKGYLGDANEKEWSKTTQNVLKNFPKARYIVPGHGEAGGKELLIYTNKLFSN